MDTSAVFKKYLNTPPTSGGIVGFSFHNVPTVTETSESMTTPTGNTSTGKPSLRNILKNIRKGKWNSNHIKVAGQGGVFHITSSTEVSGTNIVFNCVAKNPGLPNHNDAVFYTLVH